MDLIIVESPTKAKTLNRFLGSEYQVEATMGHIKDLPKSKLGVDLENNFAPDYQNVAKKSATIKLLNKLSKTAKTVYLATDPDREGEAISAHVAEIIDQKTNTKRIVFHEITKEAVEHAIANPGIVDQDLVDAQTARRVLDRLVGYKLSPLLWKKVRRGLSAGRVQSVAVRLIVEKEREIKAFASVEYWEVYVIVTPQKSKQEFAIQLVKINAKKAVVNNKQQADKIVKELDKADYTVSDVKKRLVTKNPYPPFTTSTMTQAAARIFGWSAKKTMSTAQRLYEEGLITYHRTDSLNLSAAAVDKSRKFIAKQFGKDYLPASPRFYKTKAKSAQEAHEAVRPTNVEHMSITNGAHDEERLYELIWKRFSASQMEAARYDETTIEVTSGIYDLRASGQVMKFDGWRRVFPLKLDEDAVDLPQVEKNEKLNFVKVDPVQKFTLPPARFNEASLIKTLEKLGIGRPSTYAPTISTIQARNYVEKEEGKFFPTSIGEAVTDFLVTNFATVFDYEFTAGMEAGLDEVAVGKRTWTKELKTFWDPFTKKLTEVEATATRVKIETESTGRKCPECTEGDLIVRHGRFGKFISCSRFPDCKYTEKIVQKIDMKCPDCNEGEVVFKKTKRGRKFYGCSRYPDCKFASWKKPIIDKKEITT
ncbi:MAG: type I DNA topoisomerase [Patescibacteria group bacterium]